MTLPRTLVMVRHGQSESNMVQKGLVPAPENFADRHDSHMRLTPQGVEQAKIAGQWLKDNGYNFGRQYVSPFIRTMETAHHLGIENSKWIIDDLWRERDWGEYGRYSRDEQLVRYPDSTTLKNQHAWYWKPQGGESLATGVRQRFNSILTHLYRVEEMDAVLGVSHGEFISTAQFVLEKMTPLEWITRENNPAYTIRNTNIVEYTRVSPFTGEVVDFFKWRRVTCPWNLELSHDGGEWVELEDRAYTNADLLSFVETQPRLLGVARP